MPVSESLDRLSNSITIVSDGRLVWKSNPAGSICPATEEGKAIDTGVLDFGAGGTAYMVAQIPFGDLVSRRLGGMNPIAHYCWMDTFGRDLMNEKCKALGWDFLDVKGSGMHGTPEIWVHIDKPLTGPEDLKGLKMRAAGEAGEVLKRMGVATVMLPLGELFESMTRGLIDAYECSNPYFDWKMKLNEVGKYVYLSPTRSPTEVYQVLVKRSKFEALPDDLKLLIEECGRAEAIRYHSITVAGDAIAIQNFKDYGNIVEKLPKSIDEVFVKTAYEYQAELAAKYPDYKEVWESNLAFEKMYKEIYGP